MTTATRIAHLSDTHFGTEVPRVADALLDSLDALRPDLVIVSGDVTQRARSAEFAAAQAYFARLPAPVLVLPGNHDIPLYDLFSRAFNPYGKFTRTFGRRCGAWRGSGATVLGLDSTLASRHTRGRFDRRQFLGLAAQAGAGEGVLVAAVHQPLHAAWAQDRGEVLLNAEEAAQAFAAGRVDVVLSGHVHVPVVTTTRALFPRLSRHFILAGAGTAVSHRTRPGAPNSFNLLCLHDAIEIIPYQFEDDAGGFLRKPVFLFRQELDGWQASSAEEK